MKPTDVLSKPYHHVFVPDESGGYSAMILEFNGCFSQGETLDEAEKNLQLASIAWVGSCLKRGIPIPAPMEMYDAQRKANANL